MFDPSLDQLLEACRPDSGDLELPEMAPLAAALADDESLRERLAAKCCEDTAFCEALDDVPIPAGLLARLERAVAGDDVNAATRVRDQSGDVIGRPVTVEAPASRSTSDGWNLDTSKSELASPDLAKPGVGLDESCVTEAARADTSTALDPTTQIATTQAASRVTVARPRWFVTSWLAGGLALGLVGALLGLWWNGWSHPQGPVSGEELAAAALDWTEAVSDRWEFDPSDPTAARPLAPGIRARLTGWQVQPNSYDSQSVVYSLQRDSASALLYVMRTPAPFLRDREPMQRLPSSGGVLMGAWKSGDLLFVLVVRGDQPRLDDFFAPVPPRVAISARQSTAA